MIFFLIRYRFEGHLTTSFYRKPTHIDQYPTGTGFNHVNTLFLKSNASTVIKNISNYITSLTDVTYNNHTFAQISRTKSKTRHLPETECLNDN